jgi:hypothetical protein
MTKLLHFKHLKNQNQFKKKNLRDQNQTNFIYERSKMRFTLEYIIVINF